MRGKTQSLKKHRRQKRVKMISGEKTANEQKTPISLSSSICLLLLEIKQINVEISEPHSQRKKKTIRLFSPFMSRSGNWMLQLWIRKWRVSFKLLYNCVESSAWQCDFALACVVAALAFNYLPLSERVSRKRDSCTLLPLSSTPTFI